MIIENSFQQQSPEWFAARAGTPSASCFDKIVTTQGKRSTQRKAYLYQLAGERMLGEKQAGYTNEAMQRGIELEAEARSLYEFVNDVKVDEVALCYKDDSKSVACSPDGLVGDSGGIEIKCPALNTHVEYMLGKKLPTKYFAQVQGTLWITGREWWDFVSYFPGMRLFVHRCYPDKSFHAVLDEEIGKFVDDLGGIVKQLTDDN